ncbi:hypothetical protein DTO212C5_3914 [Paecilomyces variotii]|nr:hypothetical protein DTO212C5_3914 [Paecilomyces variotii]
MLRMGIFLQSQLTPQFMVYAMAPPPSTIRYQGADMPEGCLLKTFLCVAPFICIDTEPIHPVTVAMDYHGSLSCNLQLCLVAAGKKAPGASPNTPLTCMFGLPKFQSDDTRAPFSGMLP